MDRLEYHLVVTYEQISTSRVFVYGIINHTLLQVMIFGAACLQFFKYNKISSLSLTEMTD